MILVNVIYQLVYMVLRTKAVKLPTFILFSGWPQLIPQPSRYQGLWQQWHIISGDASFHLSQNGKSGDAFCAAKGKTAIKNSLL